MEYNIIKCHGSGNDFLLFDLMTCEPFVSDVEWASTAITLCNRITGIGADGILLVENSEFADAKMRIFNADGSEASMCGNGLRCVTRFVGEKLNKTTMTIETMKKNLATAITIKNGLVTYNVEISPISFCTADLPMITELDEVFNLPLPQLAENLKFTAVAVPNPHLIAIIEGNIDTAQQVALAKKVNAENKWFPDGVNVSFVKVLKPGEIFVQTFERGVGLTNACGTAMSAASLVTNKLGYHGQNKQIVVYTPSGVSVSCTILSDQVILAGNATYEFNSTIHYNHENNSWKITNQHFHQHEVDQFQQMKEQVRKIIQIDQLLKG